MCYCLHFLHRHLPAATPDDASVLDPLLETQQHWMSHPTNLGHLPFSLMLQLQLAFFLLLGRLGWVPSACYGGHHRC